MLMTIDISAILGILALIVAGPLSWVVRSLVGDLKTLHRDHVAFKLKVAEQYVEKNHLYRELGEIKDLVRRLFDKLDELDSRHDHRD